MMAKKTAATFRKSMSQNSPVMSPLKYPPTMASTKSVSVSVMAVAPTAMVTLRWLERPYLNIMG